jgi:hypothetical protein
MRSILVYLRFVEAWYKLSDHIVVLKSMLLASCHLELPMSLTKFLYGLTLTGGTKFAIEIGLVNKSALEQQG